MCLQGFPHNHIWDSMCPIKRRGSQPGAVQVLKKGFQQLQMCDERRRQRRESGVQFTKETCVMPTNKE